MTNIQNPTQEIEYQITKFPFTHFLSDVSLKRLCSKIIINAKNNCWEWQGCRGGNGYGLITVNRRSLSVHRLLYRICKGEFDKKLLACHKCDNRICCNPEHIFLGTAKDNTADCIKKGRFKSVNYNTCKESGTSHNLSVSIERAIELKKYILQNTAKKHSEIAKILNIPKHMVRDIRSGGSCKNL